MISRKGKYKKIAEILLAWIITLPTAFAIAYMASLLLGLG